MPSTSLDIRLAEPVVFLRGSGDVTSRRRQGVPQDTAPAMVRGILTLKLAKATKIRSIAISLEGKAKTEWPEGIGARRTEVTEDVNVLSSSTVFFRAGHEDEAAPTSSARRAMSLGPGVGLDHEADDEGAISDDEDDADNTDGPRRTNNRDRGTIRAARQRRLSADQDFFHRHIVEHNEQTSILTPPYTPRTDVPSVPGSPRQTLQELRSVLRSDLASSRASVPSRPPSIHGTSGSQLTIPRPTGPHEILSAPASHVPSTNVSSDASVKSLHENISEHPSDEEAEDRLPVLRRPSPSRRESSTSFLGENEAQRAHDSSQISPPLTERQRSVSRSTASQPPVARSSSHAPHSPHHPRPILQTSGSGSLRNAGSPSPHPSSLHATFHAQTDSPGGEASPVRDRDRSESRVRGRQNTRFSLAAVSSVLQEIGHEITEITDRVRSKSRASTGPRPFGRGGAGSVGPREREQEQRLKDRALERQREREKAVVGPDETQRGRQKERTALEKISASLGLDVEADAEADMWQEFKKGTYNYPISFSIPTSTPPSLHCDFGSISYRLKAVVHRTGTFVPKLVAHAEVTLISCPGEDDTEERENIVVERQWDEQLRYFITISGKSFPIGGTVPITLVMMPLSKVKIYRITVMLEEKIDYYAHGRRVARHDPTRRYELLSLKYPNSKHDKGVRPPLLPVLDDSNNAISHSPLAGLIEGQDADEIATNLLNPNGPWTIQLQANLPTCSSPIHFTCKHTKSNIIISHWIKIMVRVERGDDSQMDKGRRKQFDIIVETPVHILSCKCNPDYTSLPPYSLPSLPVQTTGSSAGSCLCDHAKAEHQNRLQIATPPASTFPTQSPISGLGYSAFNVPPADFIHPSPRRAQISNPNTAAPDRIMGGMAVEAAIGHNASGSGERPHAVRSHESDERITTLVDRSLQFERLVSGEEGISGDMPPAYADAVDPHHPEERGRVMFSETAASRQGSRSRPGSRSRAGSRSRPGSRPASRPVSRATSMVWT
ncbi:Putative arrestin-related trafficking adapter C2D10,04 OS=Schizosaccharomyces pombe (strain 972 / ATCC 24843) GN=SPBC2D10.04 PE=1 SV=1 [Rhizoctonia solani AG-1 IB]|uniref:Putative arrestin-related trafficking adapter C2D10,04 n=1 Tax=Thanatephorus cucumeris (strain AG1-IB / isolate 7/3/14) TaxID=1108050 RepID=A0A0B7F8R2_THACB|nr:Putative arrestin-related trafficking adapter C2D10,04 OS=Schizosaccharomyces pombe (strain 972 / ATCC 24843) GN=SPBC2D10.04 PE=1 SV=1 [Rhizoctonia solani AG-1 IB]